MSLEDIVRTEGGLRLSKTYEPSKEELLGLVALSRDELLAGIAPLMLVPPNPSRKVYTVLREIYLQCLDDLNKAIMSAGNLDATAWGKRVEQTLKRKDEVEIWLSPPREPYTLKTALQMVEGSKSELWTKTVMAGVGKHRRKGQPKTKRHLAVKALDIKAAYPEATLREVTEILCPCKQKRHSEKCLEQMRQQIKTLIKFLKQNGHDFTWNRIK